MNEDNKRKNLLEEIERAKESMEAAELLFKNGFTRDAVAKLYYSLLYTVRAVLLTKGLEPKSHEGALRLFSMHFVKEGVLEAKDSHVFSKLMKYRQEADYNPSYIFTNEDYLEFQKEAEEVMQKINLFLRQAGYLS
ncbi:MAG: HEPN domain-containing protein [Desulfobacteraceae bacterium]|nr:MAG: HEPN domain-containing protein [Desulfobacteraceae bacterium]